MSLKDTDIVERSREIISSEVEDEFVMMSLENGKYYGIDSIGGDIWKILEEPHSVIDICNKLVKIYEVDIDSCKKDVLFFLESLMDQDLVKVK